MFRPLLFETLRVPAPDSYRTPPGVARENLCQYHLDKLEDVLAEHHRRIAAMVIEPLVQAAAGMIVHPPGYLRGVRELDAQVRRAADRRRGGRGLRTHRQDVRLRARRRSCPTCSAWARG